MKTLFLVATIVTPVYSYPAYKPREAVRVENTVVQPWAKFSPQFESLSNHFAREFVK